MTAILTVKFWLLSCFRNHFRMIWHKYSSTRNKHGSDKLLTSESSLRWSHSSSFSSDTLEDVLSSISLSLLSLDTPPPELRTKGALTFLYYLHLTYKNLNITVLPAIN